MNNLCLRIGPEGAAHREEFSISEDERIDGYYYINLVALVQTY